jgi:conjugative relaxase-like TrwC/TraI family protein
VLSINALASGDQGYYLALTSINYYTEGGEPQGRWYGQCRHELELTGTVQKEHLERLCEGFSHRDGESRLVRNAGKETRKPGDDLTFSAPKSVSVAWGLGPDDLRKAIEAAHRKAVQRALDYIEDACGWARTGAQGKIVRKAPLLFAVFEHGTSRAQDPQLHSHALAVNVTVLEDGKTRAFDSTHLYDHKMAAGALYRCELARGLQELGFPIRQVRQGSSVLFEIEGVPEALIEHFSKRRAEIEEKLELELGSLDAATARASELAALETRRKKETERPRSELIAEWREIALQFGITPERIQDLCAHRLNPENGDGPKERIFDQALADLEETRANFSERDLTRKVAEHAQGLLSAREVRELVEEKLTRSDRLVNLGNVKTEEKNQRLRQYIDRYETQYATPEMLRLERAVHKAAAWLGRRSDSSLTHLIEQAIAKHLTIAEDQAQAVRHLCAGGNLRLCTGDAGAGKTFMLQVCREVWDAEGRTVSGCALAGAAADELQERAGIKSTTLHQTLLGLERGAMTLDRRSVLVLDEAGMVGSRLFHRLMRQVVRADCTLVCVGDPKQLQPIEAGWIFKRMTHLHGETRLTKVRRQQVPWQLEAGRQMGRGEVAQALTTYLANDRLQVTKTTREAIHRIVARYVQDGGLENPRDKLILAGLNAHVLTLNRLCQAQMLLAGKSDPEKKLFFHNVHLHEGDRVQFTRRSTQHKVENSWLGTVDAVHPEKNTLTVRLDKDDRLVTLKLDRLPRDALRLGYASTTHKAQGKTVDYCYVLLGGPLANRHLAYVQTTRHRKDLRLYMAVQDAGPELKIAIKTLTRTEEKSLAVEILEQHRRRAQPEVAPRHQHGRGIPLGR